MGHSPNLISITFHFIFPVVIESKIDRSFCKWLAARISELFQKLAFE
jgi:hypothetical protein